jgi:hypothetical protein
MQIAIADSEGRVDLWCDYNGLDEDGSIRFSVINGAWDGRFKDNMVYVEYTKSSFPGHLVWAGSAKGRDYNDAISWIQEQIDDPEYAMLPLETLFEYNPEYKMHYDIHNDEWYDDDIPF